MSLDSTKKIVLDACKTMAENSLTIGTWGNISARDIETGYIVVTPSGMDYNILTKDDMVVFDIEGNLIEGERKPTIEKDLHIDIYKARDDVNAVIHTHPMYSTVFAVTQQDIPCVTEEFAQLIGSKVINAEYALPGTDELAENTVKGLEDRNAVLLKSHGTVCVGNDMNFTFKVCDVLEKAARILIMSKNIGIPRIVPEEDIKIMQDFVKNSYGQK